MILLQVQLRLERPAEQLSLNRQANSNPPPSPCLRTTSSHEGNPASLDQPQTRVAPNPTMPGVLMLETSHELHQRRSR